VHSESECLSKAVQPASDNDNVGKLGFGHRDSLRPVFRG
jgi:hypothetical protein